MENNTEGTSKLRTDILGEEIKKYWDREPCGTRGVQYPEQSLEYYEAISRRRYRIELFLYRFAEFYKWHGKRVLDVGCGIGSDLIEFARHGAITSGIDFSAKSVLLARERFKLYGLIGDVVETDAKEIPYQDNTFDLVYCCGVLHHIPDPMKVIREMHRVTKEDGEIRVMLYHRYSVMTLKVFLLYGLFSLKPLRSVDDIMAHHMESQGTKVYTIEETHDMFSMFKELQVKTKASLHDIGYARGKFLPKLFLRLIPDKFGWHILIKGRK